MMPLYATFEVTDFVLDDAFRDWVLQPTPERDQFWNAFLQNHPEQGAKVDEARLLVLALRVDEKPVTPEDARQSYEELRAKMRPATVRPLWGRRLFQYQIAAAVAVLLLSLGVWLAVRQWYPSDIIYQTAYGDLRTITLPDESVVTLNANSKLTVPAQWSDAERREVWLEGEAFFDVRKKPGQGNARFVVHTDKLDVNVLGTQFNVYERKGATQVVLSEGKVKLNLHEGQQKELYLKPGEAAKLQEKTGQLTKETVITDRFISWRDRRLPLNDTPVSEVARIIDETYGLPVVFEDAQLADVRLNGTSLPTDKLEKLLNTLRLTLNVEIVQEKERIIIRRQKAQ